MRRDRLLERLASGGRAVVELAHAHLARAPMEEARPLREGKELDVAPAVGEVVAERLAPRLVEGDARRRLDGEGPESREADRGGAGRLRGARRDEPLGHVRPRSDAPDDEPFGEELVVGEEDDGARDAELLREVARRRQRIVGGEGAGEDGATQPPVDLPVEGLALRGKWYQQTHGKWL